MRKGQSPFVTGVVLSLVTVYLIVYFSIKSMWNAGTIIALIMLLGISGFQFLLHFKFYRDERQEALKKTIKDRKKGVKTQKDNSYKK